MFQNNKNNSFFSLSKLKHLLLIPTVLASSTYWANETALAPEPAEPREFSEFITWITQEANEAALPGAAMAIVARDEILHLQTWGVKEAQGLESIDSNSIFRLASMSKTFAGTAAALLVEQEFQSWDTLLSDLFPAMNLGSKSSSRGINFRHVVSHSTGLMPHSFSNMLDAGVSYDLIKAKFNEIPTVCVPGKCYGYQNVVFSLTADVIEASTGETYEQYLEEQLFEPLGMISASVGLEAYRDNPDSTKPHRRVRGGWRPTSTNAAYYSVAPASGVNASIQDMAIWLRANLGAYPEVLPEDFLTRLHEPIIATPRGNYFNRWRGLENAYYATGWRVFDYKGVRAVHHGGGVRGYRSEMVLVPESNIGLVLLFNAETRLANEVVPHFLDSLAN